MSWLRESERVQHTVNAIARNHYWTAHAPAGWLYAARYEHGFIDGELQPRSLQRRAAAPRATHPRSEDLADIASAHLRRLLAISDVASLWAALVELAVLDDPAVTRDDGSDPATVLSPGSGFNIVVVGAGPIGLGLASGIRLALGTSANVLVVEDRVSAPHHKRPYDRRWLTALEHARIAELVDAPVREILGRIGTKYIGATIQVLETLLLLSCRALGVRFSFAAQPDLGFVGELADLAFDATGNRLHPIEVDETLAIRGRLGTEVLQLSDPVLASYGVNVRAAAPHPFVDIASTRDVCVPLYNGKRLTQAMLKVTEVPARLCDALVQHVAQRNDDNKFYVWKGGLREEINQGLVIVNLTRREYEALCAAHAYPLRLSEAVASADLRAVLDVRTLELLGLVADRTTDTERARIEIDAPFLWQPYLVDEREPTKLHGKPLVRVGDSIYNGNVKLANGLGPHFRHLAHIQEMLWAQAIAERATLIASTMGLSR